MAKTTAIQVSYSREEIQALMESILEQERERIRKAIHDLPIHFVDVRMHPHHPEQMRHAVELSDAIFATFPVAEKAE